MLKAAVMGPLQAHRRQFDKLMCRPKYKIIGLIIFLKVVTKLKIINTTPLIH